MSDPAIAVVEVDSIAVGILAGDAMVKASPLGSIYTGTVHPGRYVIVVSGDTASVEVAVETGTSVAGDSLVDVVFLPDVHPLVVEAIISGAELADCQGDALGVVETVTVGAVIDAADAGVKAAGVDVPAVRLADGLGGKGYVLFSGDLAEVEVAVDAAVSRGERGDAELHHVIIAQLHDEIRDNLVRDLRLNYRLARRREER
ncbi:MAG: BMC domain-containing protein [Acidimicrobiia bacterium]|nr:MAG: BMC domain-containing protein [Acidimicrobiia bacterium]